MKKGSFVSAALIALVPSLMAGVLPLEVSDSDGNRPLLSGTEHILDSSSGFFRVHWTDMGSDSTSFAYAAGIATAADSSWDVQCDQMGFFHPPPDQGSGGDEKYDIYLLNLSSGTAGYMSFAGEYQPPDSNHSCSASYICINTSLEEEITRNCTVANLFAQAVGASYDYSELLSFVLCFAAWMEEAVYPEADHYIEYLEQENPLEDPWKQFGASGSSEFPWLFMISDRWGINSVKRIWEICASQPGANTFAALEDMLSEQGTTFKEYFMDYGAWRWFTADNWFPECGMYNPDAALWNPGPCVLPVHEIDNLPHQGTHAAGFEPKELGLNWIRIDLADYQHQWIEFFFDGCNNAQWYLGAILQSQSDSLYFNWYQCDPLSGDKTVAVYSGNWDYAVFYPTCFTPGAPSNIYSFNIVSQGTGITNPAVNSSSSNISLSSNPIGIDGEIHFRIASECFVRAVVYDLSGRIRTVLLNEKTEPGLHTLQMNQAELEPGAYFIVISANDVTEKSRMILLD